MNLIEIVMLVAMAVALVIIPRGWPGLWMMLGIMAIGAVLGHVGWGLLLLAALVAGAAELVEVLIVRQLSARYGGSTRTFWGAIAGGAVGILLGFPAPVVGPATGAFLGTFIGAAITTIQEGGGPTAAARTGWGAVVARALSTGVKIAAAFVILALAVTAWIAT